MCVGLECAENHKKADKVEICELLQGKRRKRIESLIREFHLTGRSRNFFFYKSRVNILDPNGTRE